MSIFQKEKGRRNLPFDVKYLEMCRGLAILIYLEKIEKLYQIGPEINAEKNKLALMFVSRNQDQIIRQI
jgi:hypothetical protein